MREPSTIRWLRSTVLIESSCTHESRLMPSSTSAARARRRRPAKPWWATTWRLRAAREIVSALTAADNLAAAGERGARGLARGEEAPRVACTTRISLHLHAFGLGMCPIT